MKNKKVEHMVVDPVQEIKTAFENKREIAARKKLGLKLYKYQIEGVNFIEYLKGRAIIADVMGLGKTKSETY